MTDAERLAEIESRHKHSAPFHGMSGVERQYNIVREDRGFLLAEIKRLKDELYMRTRSLEEEMKMKRRGAHPDPIIDAAERAVLGLD
jgi:hypothetical protein